MHRACIHKKKEVIRGKLYVQVRGRMEGNGGNVGDVTSADSYVQLYIVSQRVTVEVMVTVVRIMTWVYFI